MPFASTSRLSNGAYGTGRHSSSSNSLHHSQHQQQLPNQQHHSLHHLSQPPTPQMPSSTSSSALSRLSMSRSLRLPVTSNHGLSSSSISSNGGGGGGIALSGLHHHLNNNISNGNHHLGNGGGSHHSSMLQPSYPTSPLHRSNSLRICRSPIMTSGRESLPVCRSPILSGRESLVLGNGGHHSPNARLAVFKESILRQRENEKLAQKVTELEGKLKELEAEHKDAKESVEFLSSEQEIQCEELKRSEEENDSLKKQLEEKEDTLEKLCAKFARNRDVWVENERKANEEVQKLDEVLDRVIGGLTIYKDVISECPLLKNLLDELSDAQAEKNLSALSATVV